MIHAERLRPGAEVADQLIQVQHQIDMLQLQASLLAAELAQTDFWDEEGFNCAGDWIRFNCHLTSNAAIDLMNVGEHAAELAESVQAMESGQIGYAHLKVMARTADAVGKVFDEAKLLALAREHSPGKFYHQCLHYRHSVDAKGFNRAQEDLHRERSLRLNTAEDGCLLIAGILDPVGGATFRNSLEALAKPSGEHDDRTREQRLADAAVELAETKTQVQLQITSSVETLLGLVGTPGAENEFSLPISSKTVERWACDSALSRILLQDSVVIDMGRAERTIKGPRRRALMARDQHCRWPGCERPARWCDVHHLHHWMHGGGGEIENQVLLCGRHHRLVHEGAWQLVVSEGKVTPVAPTLRFGRPRGPD
jgi:hypothetical protein